jgi:hypothetical protein
MSKPFIVCTYLLVILLPACSTTRTANPISIQELNSKEICVIENKKVKAEFLPIYKAALEKKGFSVKILEPDSNLASCPVTTTYVGEWWGGIDQNMSYAEIVVYRNGNRAGDALYKTAPPLLTFTYEIYKTTDKKIENMVNQLFPNQ